MLRFHYAQKCISFAHSFSVNLRACFCTSSLAQLLVFSISRYDKVVSMGLEIIIAWMRQDVSLGLEMTKKDVYSLD